MVVGSVPLRDQPGGLTLVEVPLVEPDRERADRAGALLCREGLSAAESTPPESSTPTGTSAIRCVRTESRSRSRSSTARSFVLGAHRLGRDGGRSGVLLDADVLAARRSSQTSTCPGRSFRASVKMVIGAGTKLNARNASRASRSISERSRADGAGPSTPMRTRVNRL